VKSSTADPTVVVDLDGVVWLSGEVLPGASTAIDLLRRNGFDVLFATNNSSPTIAELIARLDRAGIAAGPNDVVTSAQAAAHLVEPESTVLAIGEAGLAEALAERHVSTLDSVETVVVGWNREFTFDLIALAATAIRDGARFVATNDDPTHPTPTGLLPGTGALVAAIATASETSPIIAGKPGEAMASLVRERVGEVSLMIGDRLTTDGRFADALGVPFGLVRSEATPGDVPSVENQGTSLLAVVERYLGGH
jgi:4-nitrophenyl phosphatase